MDLNKYFDIINNDRVRSPVYRIEILRPDNTVEYTIDDDVENASGSVNVSLNQGARRAVSLNIVNNGGKYNYLFNNMRIGSRFKVSIGFYKDGELGLLPVGVFTFTDPTFNSDVSLNTISINGVDNWAGLDGTVGGILQATYTIPKGQTVLYVARSLLALDIIPNDIEFNIDPALYDIIFPFDIVKDTGSTVADLILEMAFRCNAQIYFDENGVLIIKPFEYDFDKQVVHKFFYGVDINYISATKTIPYGEIYNAVFVVGDNMQDTNTPIYDELIDNDLSNPNSYINLGFLKYKRISDYTDGITSHQLAIERCRYELKMATSKNLTVSITCMPLYHLDVNNKISIRDPRFIEGIEEYIISGLTIPIATSGTMSVQAYKARSWL